MGYMSIVAQCGGCGQTFSANPERVPCYPVDLDKPAGPPNYRLSTKGKAEPFCRECFEAIQKLREENGLPRQTALAGAWDPQEVG
jgi:hypothetical protein